MWYVYIIKSIVRDYYTYIGSTNNILRRLREHNDGLVKSTYPYRPLEYDAYVAVKTEMKARQLAKYLITGSR